MKLKTKEEGKGSCRLKVIGEEEGRGRVEERGAARSSERQEVCPCRCDETSREKVRE